MSGTTAVAEIKGFSGEFRFLSNFHEAAVTFDGHTYPTAEHAFQAAKTMDLEERRKIRQELTPGRAKRLGRKVAIRPDWEEVKFNVMLELVRQKFWRHPDLAERLVATGNARLEETNSWNDTIWGVCNGVGENRLGEILMQVRGELRQLQADLNWSNWTE